MTNFDIILDAAKPLLEMREFKTAKDIEDYIENNPGVILWQVTTWHSKPSMVYAYKFNGKFKVKDGIKFYEAWFVLDDEKIPGKISYKPSGSQCGVDMLSGVGKSPFTTKDAALEYYKKAVEIYNGCREWQDLWATNSLIWSF